MFKSSAVFPFYELGNIIVTLGPVEYTIIVDICSYGARFKTQVNYVIDNPDGTSTSKHRWYYFGEGKWLQLSTIEEAIIELGGTEEDVEVVSMKYDDLVSSTLPSLFAGRKCDGFMKLEYQRLTNVYDNGPS